MDTAAHEFPALVRWDFTYELPFAFTGAIDHVTVDLGPEPAAAPR